MRERTEISGQNIKTSVVQFKVSTQGITLTDMSRRFANKYTQLKFLFLFLLFKVIVLSISLFYEQ